MIFNMVGGAGLNFKVKAYASELLLPAMAAENTIAVITETPISSYAFSVEEPESPNEGMVWFFVGSSSSVKFNVLRKNELNVYPVFAKQYIGGSWLARDAKMYNGEKWVDFVTYLYNQGDKCTDITGGWETWRWLREDIGKASFNTSNITLSTVNGIQQGIATGTSVMIDLTNYTKLSIQVDSVYADNRGFFGVSPKRNAFDWTFAASAGITTTGILSIDISSLTGTHQAMVGINGANIIAYHITFSKMWLS